MECCVGDKTEIKTVHSQDTTAIQKLASQATFSICPLTSESAHFSDYGFDCSKEGLKHIAGYLAHKFRFKYPHLGLKTFEPSEENFTESKWISALSRGGLTLPSQAFLSNIVSFEKVLKEIQGNGLNTQYKVMQTTIDHILERFPNFPPDIVKNMFKPALSFKLKS